MPLIKGSLVCILILFFAAAITEDINDRPIIGILSQKPSSAMVQGDEDKNYTSYIAASYVKFIESAGGRVAPIMIYKEQQYYADIASKVNGILFPGGSNSIHNDSGYGMAGQYLYEEVLKLNSQGVYLPLWATCLGFEMLIYLMAGYTDLRAHCDAENIALPLIPEAGYENSLLFAQMPNAIATIFLTENVTANYHFYCYTKENFTEAGLDNDMQILSTNFDWNNFEFISTVEHKALPIFGTQWHPEKNAYEWKNTSAASAIPHFPDAIYSSQYFSNFFVEQARQNNQHFSSSAEEEEALIYNYCPKYVGNTTSSFEQVYLFAE